MFKQDRALIHIRFLIARLGVWTAIIEGSGSVWNSASMNQFTGTWRLDISKKPLEAVAT